MSEQLPDGLDLAVEMIATHVEEEVSGCRLTPSALLKKRQGVAAIAAIKSEHAQRVTMQHHAADLAQQIEDLRFAAEAGGHRIAALEATNAALLERASTLEGDNQRLEAERDELRAKLDGIEAQEPMAWRIKQGARVYLISHAEFVRTSFDAASMTPLIALQVPAQAMADESPEAAR